MQVGNPLGSIKHLYIEVHKLYAVHVGAHRIQCHLPAMTKFAINCDLRLLLLLYYVHIPDRAAATHYMATTDMLRPLQQTNDPRRQRQGGGEIVAMTRDLTSFSLIHKILLERRGWVFTQELYLYLLHHPLRRSTVSPSLGITNRIQMSPIPSNVKRHIMVQH